MVVARLLGDLSGDQPARGLEVEHEDLRFEQRGVDPLPHAASLALDQRHQHRLSEQEAGAKIVDRNADPHRALTRQAGDRHQPAHALGDLVDARPLGVGPGLAEPGDAAIDYSRVDLLHRFVIDAEAMLYGRAKVLDDNVGLLRELEKNRFALLGLQVERQAALVAVQVLEIEPLASRTGHITPRLARRLDLDDVGAPIGELANRSRPGAGMTQIENGVTGQRQCSDAHDRGSSNLSESRWRTYTSGPQQRQASAPVGSASDALPTGCPAESGLQEY